MSTELRIIPIRGIGDIHPGDDLGLTIYEALRKQDLQIEQGDIIVVTQKIVSKAEGRTIDLDDVQPSAFASALAEQYQKDARHVEVVIHGDLKRLPGRPGGACKFTRVRCVLSRALARHWLTRALATP